jgi:hypothetical protein
MSTFAAFWEGFVRFGLETFGKYYSVYRATVVDNKDPQNQGRIKVIVEALGMTSPLTEYAYPITPFAAKEGAMFFPPDVGDAVYVMFENGNPRLPLYLGGWWMKDQLPSDFRKNPPTVRGIRTKSGHEILFDETPGAEKVVIKSGGKNQVVLNDATDEIVISKEGGEPLIKIDAAGKIRLFADKAAESFILGTTFFEIFMSHVHIGNMGSPTSPPTGPITDFRSLNVFGA